MKAPGGPAGDSKAVKGVQGGLRVQLSNIQPGRG